MQSLFLSKNIVGGEPSEIGQGERDSKRGAKALKDRTSIKTEILFLERVYSFLKPGVGRVAIVLPDGILTNASLQGVRDWLLDHFQLLGVIALPQFAFAHYDAGVKASIVFMRRLAEGEVVSDDAPIFMALADKFVASKREFEIVALAPFLVISTALLLILPFANNNGQITIFAILLAHTAMCSGDFGLLSFFEYHKEKEPVTYDDVANKVSYFYGRVSGDNYQ